jgi:predicted protein tyrosine phosphatase
MKQIKRIIIIPEFALKDGVSFAGFDKPCRIQIFSSGADHYFSISSTLAVIPSIELFFDDLTAEQSELIGESRPHSIMDLWDAFEIVSFVERKEPDLLIVSCEAGISRSSAVACAIAEWNGLDSSEFQEPNYMPNPHVLETMRDVISKMSRRNRQI